MAQVQFDAWNSYPFKRANNIPVQTRVNFESCFWRLTKGSESRGRNFKQIRYQTTSFGSIQKLNYDVGSSKLPPGFPDLAWNRWSFSRHWSNALVSISCPLFCPWSPCLKLWKRHFGSGGRWMAISYLLFWSNPRGPPYRGRDPCGPIDSKRT